MRNSQRDLTQYIYRRCEWNSAKFPGAILNGASLDLPTCQKIVILTFFFKPRDIELGPIYWRVITFFRNLQRDPINELIWLIQYKTCRTMMG